MTTENCILCGTSLAIGLTNMEHYIPATVVRGFLELGVPASFTHALRINKYGPLSSSRILPIARHKEWATVRVHQKCNLDASPMCRDLRWLIDHPDEPPTSEQKDRICNYYSNIWKIPVKDLTLITKSVAAAEQFEMAYRPGWFKCGRLAVISLRAEHIHCWENDQHHHTIYLGTEEALKKIQ